MGYSGALQNEPGTPFAMSLDLQKIDVLFEWMLDGARPSADAREIVSGICERLVEAGVPLKRFALFIYTLHPNLLGRRLRWTPDAGVEQTDADLGAFDGAEYRDNPLPTVIATRREVRRRLCDPDCPDDFLILGQFRKEGVTDYLVQPLVFTTGESHAATWATSAKDGFDDSAIAAFGKIRKPLARLTETYMLRLNASNLLSAYVGRDGGHKILSGQVHRGDLEEINAAIVFADLVGFTAFSNNEPADAVLDRLNQFHDAFVPHIVDHDGELLKFMGDGVLATFRSTCMDRRRRLAGPRWPPLMPRLSARMTLHLTFEPLFISARYNTVISARSIGWTSRRLVRQSIWRRACCRMLLLSMVRRSFRSKLPGCWISRGHVPRISN